MLLLDRFLIPNSAGAGRNSPDVLASSIRSDANSFYEKDNERTEKPISRHLSTIQIRLPLEFLLDFGLVYLGRTPHISKHTGSYSFQNPQKVQYAP